MTAEQTPSADEDREMRLKAPETILSDYYPMSLLVKEFSGQPTGKSSGVL